MRTKILFFLLLVVSCLSISAQTKFYEKVSSDLSTNSAYLVFPIYIDKTEHWIITENRDFYFFVVKNEIIKKEAYDDFVSSILNSDTIISYNEKLYKKKHRLYYSLVLFYPSIVENASKGHDFFLEQYLENGFIKNSIPLSYEPLIVYYLFKWNIAVCNDCETGNLLIKFKL